MEKEYLELAVRVLFRVAKEEGLYVKIKEIKETDFGYNFVCDVYRRGKYVATNSIYFGKNKTKEDLKKIFAFALRVFKNCFR